MVRHHKGKVPTGNAVGAAIVRTQKQLKTDKRTIYSNNHTTLDTQDSIVDRSELDDYLNNVMLQHELYDDTVSNNLLVIDQKQVNTEQQHLHNNAPQSYVIPESSNTDNSELASNVIKIPRRPEWSTLSAIELDHAERGVFLEWRRNLADIEQQLGRNQFHTSELTPYEKNISVWRQLWRVIERSNIICQIVDARNPLLYYCTDIEQYCQELFGDTKKCILIINKSDYLTDTARTLWKQYFDTHNISAVFWSAVIEQQRIDKLHKTGADDTVTSEYDDSKILHRHQLIQYIRQQYSNKFGDLTDDTRMQIGFIGYPNVGKSSTINVLMGEKRVSVAAMPGKTKHFQTLNLYNDITLIDAPGLVFPTLLNSRAELVINGILNIDQLKQFDNILAPVQLIVQRITHQQFLQAYGLQFDSTKPVDAMTLLQAHAKMRGYNKLLSQPDTSRSARIIIKDYTSGKLLYCHQPPTLNTDEQHTWLQSYSNSDIVKQSNMQQSYNDEKQKSRHTSSNSDTKDDSKHADSDSDDSNSSEISDTDSDSSDNNNTIQTNRKVNKAVMDAVLKDNADPLQLNQLRIDDSKPNSNEPMTKKQLRRLLKQSRKPPQKLRRMKPTDDMNDVQVRIRGVSDQPMNYIAYKSQVGNPIESSR